VKVRIEFKLQDMWVGVFWKRDVDFITDLRELNIWICLIPCLPIHIYKEEI
jgi:hypothetical protein